jgi:hypothetical protein
MNETPQMNCLLYLGSQKYLATLNYKIVKEFDLYRRQDGE